MAAADVPSTLDPQFQPHPGRLRSRLFVVIFGHETSAGRWFDVALIAAILLSVLLVLFDSVGAIRARHGPVLLAAEWVFTILFTIEYLLRLAIVRRPWRYATSFYGVVDLLSVIPTYLSLVFVGASSLLVIRVLRILRIFRVLKLVRYIGEASTLLEALMASRRKIFVFIFSVLTLVVVFGAVMYLVEGPQRGYTSIPKSMYWAIVTLTTVGYGDISPATPLGQAIASLIMILGYGIIAIPTGIYTAELSHTLRRDYDRRHCPSCDLAGHDKHARFCRRCGGELRPPET